MNLQPTEPNYDPRRLTGTPPEIYRPVALSAVFCLVFGAVSILAFIDPYLWLLPWLGLAFSAWTSWRLEKLRSDYTGQVLAKLGLLTCLAFGLSAPTKYAIEWTVIIREARRHADQFLDLLLAGKGAEAYVLSIKPLQRTGREDRPDELIKSYGDQYRQFLRQETFMTLIHQLPQTQVTYLGPPSLFSWMHSDGQYTVLLQYRLVVNDFTYDLIVELKGGSSAGGEWKGRQWMVSLFRHAVAQPT